MNPYGRSLDPAVFPRPGVLRVTYRREAGKASGPAMPDMFAPDRRGASPLERAQFSQFPGVRWKIAVSLVHEEFRKIGEETQRAAIAFYNQIFKVSQEVWKAISENDAWKEFLRAQEYGKKHGKKNGAQSCADPD